MLLYVSNFMDGVFEPQIPTSWLIEAPSIYKGIKVRWKRNPCKAFAFLGNSWRSHSLGYIGLSLLWWEKSGWNYTCTKVKRDCTLDFEENGNYIHMCSLVLFPRKIVKVPVLSGTWASESYAADQGHGTTFPTTCTLWPSRHNGNASTHGEWRCCGASETRQMMTKAQAIQASQKGPFSCADK